MSSQSCCRFCQAPLKHVFVDLGMSPLCENFLSIEQLNDMEPFYPLKPYVCEQCFLVQLDEYVPPQEIFHDYAYFSSYSDAWLQHAKRYVDDMVHRFRFNSQSLVVELASNDGYLLQYFVAKGVPVLGIEPAANVAAVARSKGVDSMVAFFGRSVARELVQVDQKADLITANNVLAHVNDINDFVAGMKILLKKQGVITVEFPHLLRLIQGNQFDTIYHEHFSYLSLSTVVKIFAAHDLTIFAVDELWSHGGSLRIFARHDDDLTKPVLPSVAGLLAKEKSAGMNSMEYYETFAARVRLTKRQILRFLIEANESGASVVGYGAPGKGNTLLNYCGVRNDLIEYVVDRNPHKHGKYLPGTHIPVREIEEISRTKPDFVFILPWNLRDEIMNQMSFIADWGGRFVVPIPVLQILPSPAAKKPRNSSRPRFSQVKS